MKDTSDPTSDKRKAGEVVIDNVVANIDNASLGNVSYAWTDAAILAIRNAFTAGTEKFWYWWVVDTGGKQDRHPGNGLSGFYLLLTTRGAVW